MRRRRIQVTPNLMVRISRHEKGPDLVAQAGQEQKIGGSTPYVHQTTSSYEHH